jgi:hypothetical protein
MSSPGNRFLGGYGPFVRRFVAGYLLLCAAGLLALLVTDIVFPNARVYGRILDFVRAHQPPAETAAKP